PTSVFKAVGVPITPGMAIDALLGDYRPDIIHVHEFRSFQSLAASLLSHRVRAPLLLQPHGTLTIALGKERLKHVFDRVVGRQILRSGSRIAAISETEAEACRRMGIPKQNSVRLNNGVRLP